MQKSIIIKTFLIIGFIFLSLLLTAQQADSVKQLTKNCLIVDSSLKAPLPIDPYPIKAAGWGPSIDNYLFYSRWVEDWSVLKSKGNAPKLKSIPLGRKSTLSLTSELRLRTNFLTNELLLENEDYVEGQLRFILGADLRFNKHIRLFTEAGIGQLTGVKNDIPQFRNNGALQQLFLEFRGCISNSLVGAMIGRQEFNDGPRQIVSFKEGPNLRLTWNGVRFYLHRKRFRVGAYLFLSSVLHKEFFKEEIDPLRYLSGVNASFVLSKTSNRNIFLDPFVIHTEIPNYKYGTSIGMDKRNSVGFSFFGNVKDYKFSLIIINQNGQYINRPIQAWGIFTDQSILIYKKSLKPQLTLKTDIGTGGGAFGTGIANGFNQLYSGANYLGQARFLNLNNLILIVPGISVTPYHKFKLSFEYGFAQRFSNTDALYNGSTPYKETQLISDKITAGFLRISSEWSITKNIYMTAGYEHFKPKGIAKINTLAQQGSYGYVSVSFLY